jgi:HTH-type transcriptional regulator / antitoxin HigA
MIIQEVIVITNERQFRISNAELNKFRSAMASFDLQEATKRTGSSLLAKVEIDAMTSEAGCLEEQLNEYADLKSGRITEFEANSFDELPQILVKARIARGLTQRKFADLVNLKEQQIQRYEAEQYATAKLSRLRKFADALDLAVSETGKLCATTKATGNITNGPWSRALVKEVYKRGWFAGFQGTLSEAVDNSEGLVSDFIKNTPVRQVRAVARQRLRVGSKADANAMFAWQCRILQRADRIKVGKAFSLKVITEKWLSKLVRLSSKPDSPVLARKYLAGFGIKLVVEAHLPQTYLDGAAFLLPDGTPVIGMTLRYDRLDNFWFVLIHELVHVWKHLAKGAIEHIFDDLDAPPDELEQEADAIAGAIFIDDDKWETSIARYVHTEGAVNGLAEDLGISPAIIAGRIRNETQNFTILASLVCQGQVRTCFTDECFT